MTTANLIDVLLVEDNNDDAELTIRELKKYHLANNLHHAKDGEEALKFIFDNKDADGNYLVKMPKLILLDIKMPKLNGIELLEKLKQDDRTKLIPVVILTSSNEDPDIKKCYELGANSYIVKPVHFSGFAESIKNIGLYWILLNQSPI